MGYSLRIGEHITTIEDGEIYHDAEERQFDNAPADGSPTDYTNSRWPSYSGWSDFINGVGLKDLFDGENPLMSDHPGYAIITKKHKKAIDKVYKDIKKFEQHQHGRLEWLKFWVDWALKNCKEPVFVNS